MFFEKAVLKILGKFLENHFSRDFPKILRTSILTENFPIDAPYFIKENLWVSAADEATLKNFFWWK